MKTEAPENNTNLLRNALTIVVSILLMLAAYYLLYINPVEAPQPQVEAVSPAENGLAQTPVDGILESFMVWP